jgi:DNA-binding NtrC family response regulator
MRIESQNADVAERPLVDPSSEANGQPSVAEMKPVYAAGQKILVVEDDRAVQRVLQSYLTAHGFTVEVAGSCQEGMDVFARQRPDLAVVDYQLPDGTALNLLPRLRSADPSLAIVILTGFGSIELAVRAIKEGADQFLTKPVELATLSIILRRLIESRRDRRQRAAGTTTRVRERADPFLGVSAPIRQLADLARRILASGSPVLIEGETGTGKGVLARWLHENGTRAEEAFVDINCAGLSREFLETELFGHEKGAFTGAQAAKAGLLELADRGTVFLDEIGDVDSQVQPKLLKVLEEKQFRRLGSVQDRLVDIRLIAATHQQLDRLVEERTFRSDLYYRISALVLHVPPLRERREDIPLLARHFLRVLGLSVRHADLTLSPEAEQTLVRHRWPGNIRELRNVIERAVLLSNDDRLDLASLDPGLAADTAGRQATNTQLTLLELERNHIETVLAEEEGRIEPAARRLGIHRSSLYNKIKRHGIDLSRM